MRAQRHTLPSFKQERSRVISKQCRCRVWLPHQVAHRVESFSSHWKSMGRESYVDIRPPLPRSMSASAALPSAVQVPCIYGIDRNVKTMTTVRRVLSLGPYLVWFPRALLLKRSSTPTFAASLIRLVSIFSCPSTTSVFLTGWHFLQLHWLSKC